MVKYELREPREEASFVNIQGKDSNKHPVYLCSKVYPREVCVEAEECERQMAN